MSESGDAGSSSLAPAEVLASAGPVGVLSVGRLKPGADHDRVRRLAELTLPVAQAEPGCEHYAIHASVGEPGVYVFYGRWSSGPDVLGHLQNPGLQDYRTETFANLDFETTWLRSFEA
ncbi:Quinol monooxygenase YgiN [Lentzea xinjiangensis]|uniref:Quinol monooxygenase YgiN n=1 Tax=Lentzea xinjiangensis TaxID=402600 RepID=A0A1H9PDS3_9PSEU|nr:antibiotic biosynthesis monooxygenase [Lentzea xinjiangensis]SER46328.1 Quinol monooxygenase YgiN [Lentzea xinjiangensis]